MEFQFKIKIHVLYIQVSVIKITFLKVTNYQHFQELRTSIGNRMIYTHIVCSSWGLSLFRPKFSITTHELSIDNNCVNICICIRRPFNYTLSCFNYPFNILYIYFVYFFKSWQSRFFLYFQTRLLHSLFNEMRWVT